MTTFFKTTEGKRFKVFFRHEYEEVPANPLKAKSEPHARPCSTHCSIVNVDNTEEKYEGVSRCFSGDEKRKPDRFNYKTGRKLALTRALKETDLDKDERTRVWHSYLYWVKNEEEFNQIIEP